MERDRKTIRHADGIYVLGNSPDEFRDNLEEVFKHARVWINIQAKENYHLP